ncbi:hypothetical protein [Natrinema halophilum]|uniref:Uncharacterized protein n=1 Tax=Natrinema halophilum TaxID=1699371 RepID=A0A7D5KIM5_9EURY|nr:hypothetical protein [Natrinema halophilum]QLG48699.1 hypothetical protein HYG82_07490 [Natrinema halophilum]
MRGVSRLTATVLLSVHMNGAKKTVLGERLTGCNRLIDTLERPWIDVDELLAGDAIGDDHPLLAHLLDDRADTPQQWMDRRFVVCHDDTLPERTRNG